MRTVKFRNLKLGDVVVIGAGMKYSHATVIKINTDFITFFRPYVHTGLEIESENEASSLIPYVGIEQFNSFRDSDTLWTVVN